MIIRSADFQISAVSPKQYPEDDRPQIVFVGKSNVGKSSFINTLLNRKKLARTSSSPGKTRQINFYDINHDFYFVDLPGYGYSKMSKTEQAVVGQFIEQYLKTSKKIALVVFLIDIRHEPSSNDRLMYDYVVRSGNPCIIIANKADKIAVTKVDAAVEVMQNDLNPLKDYPFFPASSERKIYKDVIWDEMEKYI